MKIKNIFLPLFFLNLLSHSAFCQTKKPTETKILESILNLLRKRTFLVRQSGSEFSCAIAYPFSEVERLSQEIDKFLRHNKSTYRLLGCFPEIILDENLPRPYFNLLTDYESQIKTVGENTLVWTAITLLGEISLFDEEKPELIQELVSFSKELPDNLSNSLDPKDQYLKALVKTLLGLGAIYSFMIRDSESLERFKNDLQTFKLKNF
jgi:hypothetical protein